jgi:putative ABC transport system permease protein
MKLWFRLIIESFVLAWQALRGNVMRTTLSLLGVMIGIFCIILSYTAVDSMELEMKSSFDMIGEDLMFIQKWPIAPEEGETEYAWWKYMQRREPRLSDQEQLGERLTLAEATAFQVNDRATVEYENSNMSNLFVTGGSHEYKDVITLDIEQGRYFTPVESRSGRDVAIIGYEVAEGLFGSQNPIGSRIKVNGLKVSVIGVFEKEGTSLFENGFDRVVLVPVTYAKRLMDINKRDCSIFVKAREGVSNEELKAEVTGHLRSIRSLKPSQKDDFSIIEATLISDMIDGVMGVAQIVGTIIGIFALLVGMFSIANIMFVSVKERTNIIGIQKSLGAKNNFILGQFLFEASALCLIGGAMGMILVYLVVLMANALIDFNFVLTLQNIIIGTIVSLITGIVAGIVPAYKASRLSPVEAIRSK